MRTLIFVKTGAHIDISLNLCSLLNTMLTFLLLPYSTFPPPRSPLSLFSLSFFPRVHQANLVFQVLLVLLVPAVVAVQLPWVLVRKVPRAMGMSIEMSQRNMTST